MYQTFFGLAVTRKLSYINPAIMAKKRKVKIGVFADATRYPIYIVINIITSTSDKPNKTEIILSRFVRFSDGFFFFFKRGRFKYFPAYLL